MATSGGQQPDGEFEFRASRYGVFTLIEAAWNQITGRTRRCPACAESIRPAATVCPHCQRDVGPAR